MKVVTNFGILMRLASELGKAKHSRDVDRISKAKKEHDDYKELCLQSDEMTI